MAARWALIVGLLLLLPHVASSSHMVFQLYGDVYPTRHIYVNISIGEPPNPYFLDIDTGSNLTWLECQPCISCNKVPHKQTMYRSTPDKLVPCTHPLCIDLHKDLGNPPNMCTPQNKCTYEIQYIEGRSNGVLIRGDKFSLHNARPNLAFGCGHDQHVGPNFEVELPVDGILGLGKGSLDLVSQLKNQRMITEHVIGHCISIKGGGFLIIGLDRLPSSGITWVPMDRSRFGDYYSPGSAKLHFNGNPLRLNPMEVVFDSGSTYTYFAAQPYEATLSAVKNSLGDSLKTVPDRALPVCWGGDKPFKSVADVKKFFKSLSLIFQHDHNKATMEIPPENYLIISKDGNVCLGILDGSRHPLGELNIIGDVTMQDQIVIYDNERSRLGWAHTRCDRMPRNEYVIAKPRNEFMITLRR